jgi:hypothetical protein
MLVIGAFVYILSGHDAGFWGYIIPIFLSMFVSIPFTYRYARVLMLYLFSPIKFDINLINNK